MATLLGGILIFETPPASIMSKAKNNRSAWGRSGYLEEGREGEKSGSMLCDAFRFGIDDRDLAGHATGIDPLAEQTITES